jgi:hypothetical protein
MPQIYDYYGHDADASSVESSEPAQIHCGACALGMESGHTSTCPEWYGENDDDDDDDDDYRESRRESGLQYYSYNPGWTVHGRDSKATYGLEVEVTSRRASLFQRAQRITRDLAVYKEDGSVDGFEMVTHPMTYHYARDNFPWEVFADMADSGCTVQPRDNGIHVHVGRNSFDTPSHIFRWFKLIYRNQAPVLQIARRHESEWARFTASHKTGQFSHVYKGHKPTFPGDRFFWIYSSTADRYMRVNLAEPLYIIPANQRNYAVYRGTYYQSLASLTVNQYDREYRSNRQVQNESEYPPEIPDHYPPPDGTQAAGRYQAINTCSPHNTYEVRVFASSLIPEEVQAALQLCAASVEYTRTLTAHDVITHGGWTWPQFRSYVQSDNDYPELAYAMGHRTSFTTGHYTTIERP